MFFSLIFNWVYQLFTIILPSRYVRKWISFDFTAPRLAINSSNINILIDSRNIFYKNTVQNVLTYIWWRQFFALSLSYLLFFSHWALNFINNLYENRVERPMVERNWINFWGMKLPCTICAFIHWRYEESLLEGEKSKSITKSTIARVVNWKSLSETAWNSGRMRERKNPLADGNSKRHPV